MVQNLRVTNRAQKGYDEIPNRTDELLSLTHRILTLTLTPAQTPTLTLTLG